MGIWRLSVLAFTSLVPLYRHILSLSALVLALPHQAIAQTGSAPFGGETNSLQTNVAASVAAAPGGEPEPAEVGPGGEFSLQVPVLSVPSRNGTGFDLQLAYTPGVPVTAEASWVGLGWTLGVGTITRSTIARMDEDLARRPTVGGSFYPADEYRDAFTISLPIGSATFHQIAVSDAVGETDYTFDLEEHRPWLVSYDRTANRFIVTTEDGTRYVFGLALVGLTNNVIQYNNLAAWIYDAPGNEPFSSWHLTAILPADYQDGGGDALNPLDSATPSADNLGDWVAIEYEDGFAATPGQDIRKWFAYRGPGTDAISLAEVSYPSRITTPTHYAQFTTEAEVSNPVSRTLDAVWADPASGEIPAPDATDGSSEMKRRLKKVDLYQAGSATALTSVSFGYVAAPAQSNERTMLESMQVSGGGTTLPEHRFEYFDVPFSNRKPDYSPHTDPQYNGRIGNWGWYNGNPNWGWDYPNQPRPLDGCTGTQSGQDGCQQDGQAWNLKKITYPTGGSHAFTYESDRANLWATSTPSQAPFLQWAGGTRLASQTVSDGSAAHTYTYSYSTAHTDGTVYDGGQIQWTPLHYLYQTGLTAFETAALAQTIQGQIPWTVHYGNVTQHRPDGSKVVTRFNVRPFGRDVSSYSSTPQTVFDRTLAYRGQLVGRELWSASPGAYKVREESISTVEVVRARNPISVPQGQGNPNKTFYTAFSSRPTQRTIQTTEFDGLGASRTTQTVVTFAADGQVSKTTQTIGDGTERITEITRAAATYSGMASKNMVSQPYSVTVSKKSGATTDIESRHWTTWALSNTVWRPSETWAWRGAGDGTTNDLTAPTHPGNSETIRTGAVTAYDAHGRPTTTVDALGGTTSSEYGPSNTGPYLTRLIRPSVNGISLSTTFGYDALGRVTSTTDANNATTTFRYDGVGRLTGLRNAETPSGSWTTEYTYGFGASGQPNWVKQIDRASSSSYAEVVTYTDGLARRIQRQTREGAQYVVEAWDFDALGRPWKTWMPYRLSATSASYDANFQANAAASNVSSVGRPYREVTYTSDPTGRIHQIIGEQNTSAVATHFDYPLLSLDGQLYTTVRTTDEMAHVQTSYSDALGRSVATTAGYGAPEVATTRFTVDVLDRATATTAPEGQVTTTTYDPLGRTVRSVSPDAGTVLMKYDHAGNLRFRQDANEAASAGTADDRAFYTEVDALSRPTETGQGAATGSGSPTWSSLSGAAATPATLRKPENQLSETAYDKKPSSTPATTSPWYPFRALYPNLTQNHLKGRVAGTVSKASDGAWQAEFYSYDREGRVTTKWIYTTTAGASPSGVSVQSALNASYSYSYDWQGRPLTTVRTVGGTSFRQWYAYNATGQLVDVRHSTSATKPSSAQITYTYNARGLRSSYQYTGGPSVALSYTARGWLSQIGVPDINVFPFSERRRYHPNGLVSEVEVRNIGVPAEHKHYRYTMGVSSYDALGRLLRADTSVPYPSGGWYPMSWHRVSGITYDRNGNIQTLQRTNESGVTTDNFHYDYTTGTNRLSFVADAVSSQYADNGVFAYDANGNATAKGIPGAAWTFDWRNLPKTVTRSGTTTTYRYSAAGDRYWSKTGTATAEHVALDGATTIGRFSESGALTEWTILADGAVVGRQPASGSARYYHKDALGSVRAVTSGTTIVEARDYDPWGLEMPGRVYVSGARAREGFTGHDLDVETGFNYAGARYYMPALGRFTSVDPHAASYPGWSPYSYAFNNPLRYTDPTGMDPCKNDGMGDGVYCLPEITVVADRMRDANAAATTLPLAPAFGLGRAIGIGSRAGVGGVALSVILYGHLSVGSGAYGRDAQLTYANLGYGIPFDSNGRPLTLDLINLSVSFPSAAELARRLGVNENAWHREIKPEIVRQHREEAGRINSTNPDIGVNGEGNIVLKNPQNGKTTETDTPLEAYGD